MKKLFVLMAFIGLSRLVHASDASFMCKGVTIQNGYITYLKDVFIESNGSNFELKIGQLSSQTYFGDINYSESGSDLSKYSYFELFSLASTRPDSFLAGFTLRNDESAYLNMLGGQIFNFICSTERSTPQYSKKEECRIFCEGLRSGWGYQACLANCRS